MYWPLMPFNTIHNDLKVFYVPKLSQVFLNKPSRLWRLIWLMCCFWPYYFRIMIRYLFTIFGCYDWYVTVYGIHHRLANKTTAALYVIFFKFWMMQILRWKTNHEQRNDISEMFDLDIDVLTFSFLTWGRNDILALFCTQNTIQYTIKHPENEPGTKYCHV